MSNLIITLYAVTFTSVIICTECQQLPLCPQSIQWFPQAMPMHCVMPINCNQCKVNCNGCPPPCRCVPPPQPPPTPPPTLPPCPQCSCMQNFVSRPNHCPVCPPCNTTPRNQPMCPPCTTPCVTCIPIVFRMCSPCHASCACKPQGQAQCMNPPCMPMMPVIVVPFYAPHPQAPYPRAPRSSKPKYNRGRNGYEYEQEPQIIPVLSYVFPNGTVLYQKKISEASAARWLKIETRRRYSKNAEEDYASQASESDEEEYDENVDGHDHEVAKQIARSVSEQKKIDSQKQKALGRKRLKRIQDMNDKKTPSRDPSVYKVGKERVSKRHRYRHSDEYTH